MLKSYEDQMLEKQADLEWLRDLGSDGAVGMQLENIAEALTRLADLSEARATPAELVRAEKIRKAREGV